MLSFENNTLEKLCIIAKTEYPKECCGILLGRRENGRRIVNDIIQTENTADEQESEEHFRINPLEILKAETEAEQKHLEIIGFFHSHTCCSAVASIEDIRHMIKGYSYPIISVKNGICAEVVSFEKIRRDNDTAAQKEDIVKEN